MKFLYILLLSIVFSLVANSLELKPLKDDKGNKFSGVKSFYRKKTFTTQMQLYLEELGIQRIKTESKKYEADLYYEIERKIDRSPLKEQMTLVMTPMDRFIDNKYDLSVLLQEMDEKKLFDKYDSLHANPESYQLDFGLEALNPSELKFLSNQNTGMWILKPAHTLQGWGIKLVQNVQELEEAIRLKVEGKHHPVYDFRSYKKENKKFVLQKYVENPLLQDGKKFDMRQFFAILSTDPFIAVYFPGYTRKTMVDYDRFSDSLFVHLGNGDVQKKLKDYETKRQVDHNYDRELFKQKLMKDHENYTEEDYQMLEDKCKASITYALLGFKDKIQRRKGDTQVFSADMIVDENFNPYIVEFNRNPYLVPGTDILQSIFPKIVRDWYDGSAALHGMSKEEIIERSKQNKDFICEVADRHDPCHVIINEAIDWNFIQSVDLDKWSKPEEVLFDENNKEEYYKHREAKRNAQLESNKKWNQKHHKQEDL